jgi:endonuclease/exonuclease/phosphatase family metal-dependent hydrolase
MNGRRTITLFMATALLGSACSCHGKHREPSSGDAGGPAPEFRADTYNGGLGPGFMKLATPRIPAVAQGVAALDSDVLCLQEIWTVEAADAVAAALDAAGMDRWAEDTTGENETGKDVCTAEQIQPMVDCVAANCADVVGEDVTLCAVKKCQAPAALLYLMAAPCLNCVLAQPGKQPDEIRSVCVDGNGASRLYSGRNSMILASRYIMTHREALRLPSSGANRVALMATIVGYGDTPIEVGCVHLSAKGAIPPTEPGFKDWDAERLAQFTMVSDRLKARANGRPTLLLGDMNIPADPTAELYAKALAMGFQDPAADAAPPFCSSCKDNLLKGDGTATGGSLIDHVLTRDLGSALHPVGASRFLDQPVTVIGHDGNPVVTHPSDHYGVRVTFAAGGK